jgi:citrate lyase subunit beta/citryl-CoA lyase
MTFRAKPLRSELFVPGNKEDWMRKAPRYGADALILDLEDSVPPVEKAGARVLVRKMLEELGPTGQTLLVRVNRLETGLTGDDLEAITCPHLYAIMLPKVEGPADVIEADILLKLFERRAGMEVGQVLIDPGLESAQGMRLAYEVATSSARVAHMGAAGGKGGDPARSIGFQWTPEGMETLFFRSKVLLDSRAAGIPYPVTGGWMDLHNLDGLREAALQARRLGYTGMHLIHPSHVPVVNEVFTPNQEEIAQWQGVIAAMEEGRKRGDAAVPFQGDMIDIAHEETAKIMLARARELGVLKS